ncbi:MAG: iron-sulfur cluster repair di-iron protein [Candidatus Abyssobacteria bacterium SURF_5]|uniref:Iron-sulfur cluster repair di-iron protein n=1 Tax=Abyssobacteria bacterium (strain SURF_5) TaxID=2093360 RepID=A0A3A4NX12_ABYX5|nr:MAG: iron-sulfur cluster repair di-iron protein [Candidatus Abyssubacteria bacterium SURF_5]
MEGIITRKTTVRDVVVNYPQTRAVFEKYRIDYCCGGAESLEEALRGKNVTFEKLSAELDAALKTPENGDRKARDWSTAAPTELADYIEQRHHGFMKAQLPRVRNLLAAVQRAHAERHGRMLNELRDIYDSLQWEIEQHLMKEEQILFPYIRRIEAFVHNGGQEPVVHCGSIQNPIRQMEHEHENAGGALEKMRELTKEYSLPEDACATFRAVYEGLQAIEADLHEHIHLENNILFPKAIELECVGKAA